MKYKDYTIEPVKEKSAVNVHSEPFTVTSYRVLFGKKVVEAGLPTQDAAKVAIDRRSRIRERAGLPMAG